MLIAAVIIGYLLGCAACCSAFAAIGEADPQTRFDSWTGDDGLDAITVIVWPLTILLWISSAIGRRVGRRISGA